MASSSKPPGQLGQHRGDDGEPPLEEFEGFDDFTLASSWERFISDIEAVCRLWMVDGPKNLVDKGAEQVGHAKNLYKVKSELKYGIKSYCMEYYFEVSNRGGTDEWSSDLNNLQLLFGVNDFVVIIPASVSGVVLDAPEASKLLSSVAIALSNCGSVWPAFVPVHDPSRKAYIGIQNMGMTFTRRFDTDRIGSQVPVRLLHLEGLYELFVSKFALSATDISMRNFDVHFTMKLIYRTPPYEEYDDMQETDLSVEENTDNGALVKTQWDDDCPWTEWYSAEDPIKGFELTAIWSKIMIESSIQMAEVENASSFDAEKWILGTILSPTLNAAAASVLIGFASQLKHLVSAFEICYGAKFIEDFISAENPGSDNLKSPSAIPPPSVIDRVLKDIFSEVTEVPKHSKRMRSNSQAIKGAPIESLFAQFCLHALWLSDSNIRAIAVLWIEFVREIRWCWEESESLPRMPNDGVIDLSACLIHQKLQMLAICIQKRSTKSNLSVHDKSEEYFLDVRGTYEAEGSQIRTPEKQNSFLDNFEGSDVKHKGKMSYASAENSDHVRMGSPDVFESMMLLRSYEKMRTPRTQDTPIMTEDMHEERIRAVEAFGDSYNFSALLERDILSSDMSSFKDANPDAIFEDFIRWHSPGDWESDEIENPKPKIDDVGAPEGKWPPHGRLSQRMSEHGNSWRQIWNDSPPLPASLQKPLFDPEREGEKVLHYLETLRPHQLLAQMICTVFRGALDTLNQTSYGGLKLMKSKIEQLYLIIASSLKPLKGNQLPDKTELIPDLNRLCTVFGHVEKLLLFAASIHRKLLDAPRLSEAIFNSYHNYYLPKLETCSSSICHDKEFDCKHQVKLNERDHVASLFPPPTANQSWRKVLSMGNLLNGHEPIIRQIIFSVNNKMGSSCYGTSTPWASTEKIETQRMYICGTSNDLQVALSVISWD